MNGMTARLRALMTTVLCALILGACGGGGGDRAPGVAPGPLPPGAGTPPPDPLPPGDPTTIAVGDITPGDVVTAQFEGVTMASPPTLTFRLEVDGRRVTGLGSSNVSFSLAQLVPEVNFGISSWTSYIARTEDPVCRSQADVDNASNACTTFTAATDPAAIPDSALKVSDPVATGRLVTTQATTERNGTLTDNGDGTWRYRYATNPGDPAGLTNLHRACLQLSLNAPAPNLCVDFLPADLAAIGLAATSLTDGFYDSYDSRQVVADGTCNGCHAKLSTHGGGRTDTEYCVTCHNPGSTDANSTNTVDFKVLVHRIHYARNLDSVQAGTPYKLWGFSNAEHDYSTTSYPQNVRNCTRCHAGQEDVDYALAEGLPPPEATITPDGHNWASKPNPDTCLACHESAAGHAAGRTSCAGCHAPGRFQSVQVRHRDLLVEQGRALDLSIEAVRNTAAGEFPVITFAASRGGNPIDVLDPNDFVGAVRFRVAWDAASEYLNSGGSSAPISVTVAAGNTTPLGGGRFEVDTAGTTPIPPDIDTLGVSGALDETAATGNAAARSPVFYAASSAAAPTARRLVVSEETCNACHQRIDQHAPGGRSVTDNPQGCVGCHEPNRQSSGTSTDFSVLIHGLHASGIREQPYRSWDPDRIQFPGILANCATCHVNGSHRLPLPLVRAPLRDASSTEYTTAIAAACSACHDDTLARSHMVSAGGAVFNGTFQAASDAVEGCEVCHRSGASADIDVVHAR